MNFVWMTDVNTSRILLRNNRQESHDGAWISFDSTYIRIDKFKELATARKNHIVSPDH